MGASASADAEASQTVEEGRRDEEAAEEKKTDDEPPITAEVLYGHLEEAPEHAVKPYEALLLRLFEDRAFYDWVSGETRRRARAFCRARERKFGEVLFGDEETG